MKRHVGATSVPADEALPMIQRYATTYKRKRIELGVYPTYIMVAPGGEYASYYSSIKTAMHDLATQRSINPTSPCLVLKLNRAKGVYSVP